MKNKLSDVQKDLVDRIVGKRCCGPTMKTKKKEITFINSCCGSNQPIKEQPKSNGGCCG